jgi:hypothetical protein
MFYQTVICPTGSVKYLGVILDAKLIWMEHVTQRISKATLPVGCVTGPSARLGVLN